MKNFMITFYKGAAETSNFFQVSMLFYLSRFFLNFNARKAEKALLKLPTKLGMTLINIGLNITCKIVALLGNFHISVISNLPN